jgi:hypothetical protein
MPKNPMAEIDAANVPPGGTGAAPPSATSTESEPAVSRKSPSTLPVRMAP